MPVKSGRPTAQTAVRILVESRHGGIAVRPMVLEGWCVVSSRRRLHFGGLCWLSLDGPAARSHRIISCLLKKKKAPYVVLIASF